MMQETPNRKHEPIVPLSQREVPSVVVRLELTRAPQSTRIIKTSWKVVVPATDFFESDAMEAEYMAAAYDIGVAIIRASAVDYANEMKRGGK